MRVGYYEDTSLSDTSIITGEGVALELPAATGYSRIVSGFIDYSVYCLLFVLLSWYVLNPLSVSMSIALNTAIGIFSIAVVFVILPALVTFWGKGWTLGKLLTRTRVVRSDGGTITASQCFIRSIVGIVEVLLTLGVAASCVCLFSRRGARWGDMLADAYVVRWPKMSSWMPPARMPDSLIMWANNAQTRPLPTGLSLNIADYLKNRDRLTAQARISQGRALAAACERYVSPPPPWGTPPELFLEAMTVIRYNVEFQRYQLSRDRQIRAQQRISAVGYY
ncbi:RDD family protein [Trueperella sp. LYQ143]|uniref:RDD family protein n=1 Tax=unclassified Trueperella TaxID=2630174 RepID=UPI003982FE5A